MDAETIRDRLRKQPFEPFEIRLSNGDVHQVRHPELAFVVKFNMVIGDPDTGRVSICSILHIVSINTLQAAS